MTLEQTSAGKGTGSKKPRKPPGPKPTPEQKAAAAAARDREKAEKKRIAEEKRRVAAAAKAEKARAEEQRKRDLAERAARVGSAEAFTAAIRKAVTSFNQLVALKDVAAQVDSADRKSFSAHWQKAIASTALPRGVSSLLVGTKTKSARKLFLVNQAVPAFADLASEAQPASSVSAARLSTPLKDRLLAEFDRLDEQSGGRFYVTLFDLRHALPEVSRSDFDAALQQLRKDWILSLTPAEGRQESVPANVREAGIVEQSKVLVYAARRET